MTDLASGKIGAVGNYDLAFTNGQVIAQASVNADGANIGVSITISPASILNLIAQAAQQKTGSQIPAEVATFLETALGLK